MHLEHIYAYNDENRALFKAPHTGLFDEAAFDQTRNLLGMVLLLKDLQNLSSGNDVYKDKRHDYARSDLIWNQMLSGHLSNVDMRNLPAVYREAAIQPEPSGVFPKEMVEMRQRLFFEAFKEIWSNV